MYAVENKADFKKELESLLEKLDARIETLSEMLVFSNGENTDEKFGNLNALKLHRFKVKETVQFVEKIDKERWEEVKNRYQDLFEESQKLMKNPS